MECNVYGCPEEGTRRYDGPMVDPLMMGVDHIHVCDPHMRVAIIRDTWIRPAPVGHLTIQMLEALLHEADEAGLTQKDRAAVKRVIRICERERDGIRQERATAIAAKCSGMPEALLAIAEAGQGIVHVRTAARAMLEAGLTSSTSIQSINASLWNRLAISSRWEYMDAGRYRLVDSPWREEE